MVIEKLEQIVSILEFVLKRPHMFAQTADSLECFLKGMVIATRACLDIEIPYRRRLWVEANRGWKHTAVGPWNQMRAKGWSEEEIIREMVTIEIEIYKRTIENIREQKQGTAGESL